MFPYFLLPWTEKPVKLALPLMSTEYICVVAGIRNVILELTFIHFYILNCFRVRPASNMGSHCAQHTVHCTQHTVHSTQHTVHSTQHTVHSTQHTVHSTQYTVHSTQYTAHSNEYTAHSTQYTAHSNEYTAHSTQYTVRTDCIFHIRMYVGLKMV